MVLGVISGAWIESSRTAGPCSASDRGRPDAHAGRSLQRSRPVDGRIRPAPIFWRGLTRPPALPEPSLRSIAHRGFALAVCTMSAADSKAPVIAAYGTNRQATLLVEIQHRCP